MTTKAGTAEEGNKAVALRYVEEVWNRHDLDAIDGLVWPDYLNHAARTEEYQHGGAKPAVEWLLSVFPDHRFDVEDAAADGQTVALRGTMRGTHEGGSRAKLRGADASSSSSRTGSGWWTASWRSTGR